MRGQLPDAWHTAVLVLMPVATFVLGSWFFAKQRARCSTMSDDLAIRFEQVGKMYKVFGSKLDTTLDALNLPTFRRTAASGSSGPSATSTSNCRAERRLGIIGRNGAGKTTLLKLVTGNVAARRAA